VLSPIWPAAGSLNPGTPVGTTVLIRQLEHLGFFTGLGVVIVFVAALALGRLMVFAVRDRQIALDREPTAAEPDTVAGEPATTRTATSTTRTPPRQASL